MLIIFLISFDSGQNKIGGYRKKVDRINIWRFHGDFQEGYQALKVLTIIQQYWFALDVCRNVMTVFILIALFCTTVVGCDWCILIIPRSSCKEEMFLRRSADVQLRSSRVL